MRQKTTCTVKGCGKPARARGWCSAHYERWRVHGDPLHGGPVGVSRGEPTRFLLDVVIPFDGDDCLFWPYAKDVNGYGQLRVNGKTSYVTRVVCEMVHGNAPTPKHQAAHSCGMGHKGCCNPSHLRWDTVRGNHADKKRHGTYRAPPLCNVLSEEQVREIRKIGDRMTHRELAEKYGVGHSAINCIINRKTWAWLT